MNAIHTEWQAVRAASLGWPEWAYWRAMDANGLWHFYQCEPVCMRTVWGAVAGKEQLGPPFDPVPDWRESLMRRPM